MTEDRRPWWEDDPELEAIRRRVFEVLAGDDREPIAPDEPDPVLDEILGGARWRELAQARDDMARARTRYENAVLGARAAGYSWGEIGRVLGVSKQVLHRRFRGLAKPPAL